LKKEKMLRVVLESKEFVGVGPNSCGARSNPLTRTQLALRAFLA